MSALQKLEVQLNDVFVKKAPFQLPPNGRKGLAGALWWISLVFGVVQLWAVWVLWHLGHGVNQLLDYTNGYLQANGLAPVSGTQHLGMVYYLALLSLLVDAVILLLAVSGLKNKQKAGWNWLYYSLLLNAAYGVIRMFSNVGGGIGQLFGAVISFAIGGYLLFQVREYFMGKTVHAEAAHHTDHHEHKS
ncbi:MAG TPA: hypothetical protein VLH84_05525 [Patescibacteria group bacterium]|nr:hypothetical protein [Patescibacteria group bacterium]